jgi:hypothetical protein
MSKLYSIENLLVGQLYNSRSLIGKIVEATLTDKVYFGNDVNAYLVRIHEKGMLKNKYRYVAVGIGE